jgi:hypothetical protein
MEHDDMASDNHSDQRATPERKPIKDKPIKDKPIKDIRSSTRPSQQSGPPIVNDGPELLRSSHC